ncbi:MAG: hypothetical protein KFF49_06480, partial [Bacteroidales bacterium]|nr:hypothetical protein [Bacteroidales bacterium]
GIVTEDYLHSVNREAVWTTVVARDIVVPVISSSNPFSESLLSTGLSPSRFAAIYTEPGTVTWGDLLNTEDNNPVNCYCVGDESLKDYLAGFLKDDRLKGNVVLAENNNELNELINKDKYSIGFTRLSSLIDYENSSIREGIQVVPIDINANGKLDHNENIYTCLNDLNRGVWIGKYPGSLCRNIHIVSGRAPLAETETAFVQWILSGGQAYISEAGFSELIPGERQSKLQALIAQDTAVIDSKKQPVNTVTVFLIAATVLGLAFIIYILVKLLTTVRPDPGSTSIGAFPVFDGDSVNAPGGLFFDRTHTWSFMEKDGRVKIGIDDFLQHTTGRITNIKTKDAGSRIRKGEKLLSLVQDGKQLDIYSPVSGRITESNRELKGKSSVINSSPYSDGWIYYIEPDNWIKETRQFLLGQDYRKWLESEFTRLKDFIASTVKTSDLAYSQVILQDGGEVREGLLENFGPDVWEEFQRGFIDTTI